jgi:hypothetical protein
MRKGGLGQLVGILLLIGLALMIVKWALITVAILAVPFGVWFVYDRVSAARKRAAEQDAVQGAADRRREIESLAVVDAAGGCGWCGSRLAHRDRLGMLVGPADFHRAEIEDAVRR